MKILKRFFSNAKTLPKLYSNACILKPREYYNYKEFLIKYGSITK